ncbi:MAG TPA: 3-dehydro-L-gulonate 2-dehydrogenase [Vicinamibacterales bacterium]
MRVSYEELVDVLGRALMKQGMDAARADRCARLFADTDRDGINSHGVNRFPRLMRMIRSGVVDVHAEAVPVDRRHALERWDGRRGLGNLNALGCMDRAIALSGTHGIGCVALANTNHWMRGGTYGWQAADAGVIGICWTNTLPNMPPWGTSEPRLGNNPLIVAIPRPPAHVVLDMAMSQFSVGGLASYRMRGERLPVPGGYDAQGRLSHDPAALEESKRLLPIGFWKGSGLSLVLDMAAALLSGGHATFQIPQIPERETGLSQAFIAVRLPSDPAASSRLVDQIIEYTQQESPTGERARYPGERTLQTRTRNLAEGIPVDPSVWKDVTSFAG